METYQIISLSFEKLDFFGIGVSATGSPIGKISLGGDLPLILKCVSEFLKHQIFLKPSLYASSASTLPIIKISSAKALFYKQGFVSNMQYFCNH